MKGVAAFVMRGRYQAALTAALGALLALLIPPLLIFSVAAVVLPTLRLGYREGALVALLAAGIGVLMLIPAFAFRAPWEASQLLVIYWLPGWALASVLRWSVSLAFSVVCMAGLGIIAVLGFHLILDDPAAWGLDLLKRMLAPFMDSTQLVQDPQALEEFLRLIGPYMPGFMVSGFVTIMLGGLLVGRWWQALLFRPGGFREEFHALALGKSLALITMGVIALGLLFDALPLANLLPTLLVVYTLQSFALVHGLVSRAARSQGWLIGFYVMVFFAPQFMLLVALLALVDPWVDFRGRIGRKPPGNRGNGPS